MTAINGLSAVASVTQPGASRSADDIAVAMIGNAAAQVLGWAAHSFNLGPAAGGAWAQMSNGSTAIVEPARLAQGGDIYGLRDIASAAAGELGATPAEEGELLRALEDFTRAAALNVNALAGADGVDPLSGLAAALDTPGGGDGIGGVVNRLEAATRQLDTANI